MNTNEYAAEIHQDSAAIYKLAHCVILCLQGGMKAVMWTDTFQIVIMFGGLFAVIIKGSIDHEGFGNIWQFMEKGERINFFK